MNKTYYCTPEELKANARLPLRVMETEASMYEEIAQIMFDTIQANGDETTVIICPVGPIGHYPIFAKKVNEASLSLKNCWFINMDEYLTDDDRCIPYENPLSFHATMDRMLYSQIPEELLMPENQRLFPEPGHEAEIDALIEKLGKVDCVLTGVGINGHVAFNEPPEAEDAYSNEDYRNIGTRCANIARETITNNGANKYRGALSIVKQYGGEDLGTEYGEKWFENRITFFYPDHIMDLPQMFGTLDTVATHENIEKIYRAMKAAVETNFKQYGVRFISHSSHWYDWGAMNYSRFIIDNPPKDPEEALRVHNQIWNAGVRAALANGGVLNDHHGIGLKLSRLVKEQYGPAMQVLEALKKNLDPNGIMNPYKLGL